MPNESKNILQAITDMANDDNKGVLMTTTVSSACTVNGRSTVTFQVSENLVRSASVQSLGLAGDYLCVAFFIDRKELGKYNQPTK